MPAQRPSYDAIVLQSLNALSSLDAPTVRAGYKAAVAQLLPDALRPQGVRGRS